VYCFVTIAAKKHKRNGVQRSKLTAVTASNKSSQHNHIFFQMSPCLALACFLLVGIANGSHLSVKSNYRGAYPNVKPVASYHPYAYATEDAKTRKSIKIGFVTMCALYHTYFKYPICIVMPTSLAGMKVQMAIAAVC